MAAISILHFAPSEPGSQAIQKRQQVPVSMFIIRKDSLASYRFLSFLRCQWFIPFSHLRTRLRQRDARRHTRLRRWEGQRVERMMAR